MSNEKQKFDGYANQYDEWFMENDNLFTSELRLFKKVLGDYEGKKLLSVGCGSGLFESYIDCSGVEGIEPSRDMGAIAEKRGVNVIKYGIIEDEDLPGRVSGIRNTEGRHQKSFPCSPMRVQRSVHRGLKACNAVRFRGRWTGRCRPHR